MARMAGELVRHRKQVVYSGRHKFLGPAMTDLVQGALPAPDAFKVGVWVVDV